MMAIKLVAPPPSHGAERILNLDRAHIQRSRIVDKCAEADRHLLRILGLAGNATPPRTPFSQKIEALRRLLAEDRPIIRPMSILPRLKRLETLWVVRSELAHSTMSIEVIEGKRVVILRNAAESEEATGPGTILTYTSLKETHEELSRVANWLKQAAQRLAETGFPLSRE
jgi:hypothetical protein